MQIFADDSIAREREREYKTAVTSMWQSLDEPCGSSENKRKSLSTLELSRRPFASCATLATGSSRNFGSCAILAAG